MSTNMIQFNTRVTPDNFEWLENVVRETGLSRTKVINALVEDARHSGVELARESIKILRGSTR